MNTKYVLTIEESSDDEDPRDSAEGNRRIRLKAEILDRLEQLAEEYSGEAGLQVSVGE